MFKDLKKKGSDFYEKNKPIILYFVGAGVATVSSVIVCHLQDQYINKKGIMTYHVGERKDKPGSMYCGFVVKDKNGKTLERLFGGCSAEEMKKIGLYIADLADKILNRESEK